MFYGYKCGPIKLFLGNSTVVLGISLVLALSAKGIIKVLSFCSLYYPVSHGMNHRKSRKSTALTTDESLYRSALLSETTVIERQGNIIN